MDNLRKAIDAIDDQMQDLFVKRMTLVKQIAQKKKTDGLAVLNQDREEEILTRLNSKLDDPLLKGLYPRFIINLMEISKLYQEQLIRGEK